jgi:MFS family permease
MIVATRLEGMVVLFPNVNAGSLKEPGRKRRDPSGRGPRESTANMDPRLDSRLAWRATLAALAIMSLSFGAPYITMVALKAIAAELGGQRSIPAAATALAWLGTGVGGLGMGWLADRIGIRATVIGGILMVALGLAVSSGGTEWQLYIGHGLLIGLLGNAGINAPLYVYVTRWFDRRRGTALALIASGQYIAGAVWPPIFERVIALYGWQQTMLGFGIVVAVIVIPTALVFLAPPPAPPEPTAASPLAGGARETLFGLNPNFVYVMLLAASFLCCIPMAFPTSHLIAFCGDLGMLPARGALALSLLLACAFFSRQFWGWLSDRYGGLTTLIICSGAQAVAMLGFLFTLSEAGLFAVAAVFGLGFSGLIPAYILTARQFFPASEASWRMPLLLLTGMSGMAMGGWIAGVIYDYAGSYQPAVVTGLAANLLNFGILSMLVLSRWRTAPRPSFA